MQAIQTKFLPPTDTKDPRIKATCAAGSITIKYDYARDVCGNHEAAARALQAKLGWVGDNYTTLAHGQLADGTYAHVFVSGRI